MEQDELKIGNDEYQEDQEVQQEDQLQELENFSAGIEKNKFNFKEIYSKISGIFTTIFTIFWIIILLIIFIVFVVLVVLQIIIRQNPVSLNIHLEVSKQCENKTMEMNHLITLEDKTQKLDFVKLYKPHITVFLTLFNEKQIKELTEKVSSTIQKWRVDPQKSHLLNCNVTMNDYLSTTNAYSMWNSDIPKCLQQISDDIVIATSPFVNYDAKSTIPDWVKSIKNLEVQRLKKEYIKKYGSPNVFKQFQPHITAAVDSENTQNLKNAADKIIVEKCSFIVKSLSIGKTGPFGTVLRGQEIFKIPLVNKN